MSQLEMFDTPYTVDTVNLEPTPVKGVDFVVEIKPPIDYKFRENELINEFRDYIDNTYTGHYGHGGFQSSEVIIDRGHGLGFFLVTLISTTLDMGRRVQPPKTTVRIS